MIKAYQLQIVVIFDWFQSISNLAEHPSCQCISMWLLKYSSTVVPLHRNSPVQHENHRRGNTSYCPGNAFTWDDNSPPLLFQWCTNHIDMGISNLSTYMEDANAHVRFIPDIWMRCETDLRILESICFYLIHVYGSFPNCATWNMPHKNGNWVTWTL